MPSPYMESSQDNSVRTITDINSQIVRVYRHNMYRHLMRLLFDMELATKYKISLDLLNILYVKLNRCELSKSDWSRTYIMIQSYY